MRGVFVFLRPRLLVWLLLLGAAWSLPPAAADEAAASNPAGEAQAPQAMRRIFPALVRINVVMAEPAHGRMQRRPGTGSGFIISPQGYIVTNHHVAGRAVRITVDLPNREELPATLVATDPWADVAVIKIDPARRKNPQEPLPYATWGDSDQLKAGDRVFALGSPAGISQSITAGIVSNPQMTAPKRDRGLNVDGEDVGSLVLWIGHDAVIFGGNSGGPLANAAGEVVGINEMGLGSMSGAIPAKLARPLVEQMIARGLVERGWAGLKFTPRLRGDAATRGVLVSHVSNNSPASNAGLQPGDVVLSFNGESVDAGSPEELPRINQLVAGTTPGKRIEVRYLRGGEERTAELVLATWQTSRAKAVEFKEWGAVAMDLTRAQAEEWQREIERGVVIHSVREGGPAHDSDAPIRRGDVVLEINGRPIQYVDEMRWLTEQALGDKDEAEVLVKFERGAREYVSVVTLQRNEIEQIPARARVAWLGVGTQPVTPALAQGLGLPAETSGVRVTVVHPDQPAARAGLQVGDIVTRVNGETFDALQREDTRVFESLVRRRPIGSELSLEVLRNGEKHQLSATLTDAPPGRESAKKLISADFDVTVRELAFDDRVDLQLKPDVSGLIVGSVTSGGIAHLAGLREDDVILEVNGKATADVDAIKQLFSAARKERAAHVPFKLLRQGKTVFAEVEPQWESVTEPTKP